MIYAASGVNNVVHRLWPVVHERMLGEHLPSLSQFHFDRIGDLAIRAAYGLRESHQDNGLTKCPRSVAIDMHDIARTQLDRPNNETHFDLLDPSIQTTYKRAFMIAREEMKKGQKVSN